MYFYNDMSSISKSEPSTLSQLVDLLEKFDEEDKALLLKALRKNLIIKKAMIIDSKVTKARLPRLNNFQILESCRQMRNEMSKKIQ